MIRKKIILLAFFAITAITLQACNSGSDKNASAGDSTAKDSTSAETMQEEKFITAFSTMHRPVKAKDADTCIKYYLRTRKNEKLVAPSHISYLQKPLTDWLIELQKVTDYDTLRISMGRYIEPVLRDNNNGNVADTGKVTMFLVPYSKKKGWARYKQGHKSKLAGAAQEDDRVDAYNLGDIHP